MWTAHERLRWQIILGLVAFDAAVVLVNHIHVENQVSEFLTAFLVVSGFLAFGLFYRFVRHMERVAVAVIAITQISVFAVALALASYMAITFNRPMIDDVLYQMDQSLGFNWLASFQWVMSVKPVSYVLISAYNSTQMQIILLAAGLGLLGATERLDKFLLAFTLSGVATVGLWAIYPSFGPATYLVATDAHGALPHLDLVFTYIKPELEMLAGPLSSLDLTHMKGIVGAPSFHTIMSIVTVRAVAGLGKWFWMTAGWNVIVLISVPFFGGHNLMDMIAGAVVAGASIVLADSLTARIHANGRKDVPAARGQLIAAE
jgi:hypothetical protein